MGAKLASEGVMLGLVGMHIISIMEPSHIFSIVRPKTFILLCDSVDNYIFGLTKIIQDFILELFF